MPGNYPPIVQRLLADGLVSEPLTPEVVAELANLSNAEVDALVSVRQKLHLSGELVAHRYTDGVTCSGF